MKKVTFGITNCNRLYYLKSCLESLLICTEDYDNKEIIIVDNTSVENGTEEYLKEKEAQGVKVFRQPERDPSNEFAKALNLIVENSSGDYVCPLQGDMQFIVKGGWLRQYIDFCETYPRSIGAIAFDAQRRVRIKDHSPYFGCFDKKDLDREFKFYIDAKRPPVSGAADVFYPRWLIEKVYPWNTVNKSHEGGNDSETHMLHKVKSMLESGELSPVYCIVPQIPVSSAIYTDARGTMGRVRHNRRYGDYWEAKSDNLYYDLIEYKDALEISGENNGLPLPIETMAKANGWTEPLDSLGNWKKNPIRPETATEKDYVELT